MDEREGGANAPPFLAHTFRSIDSGAYGFARNAQLPSERNVGAQPSGRSPQPFQRTVVIVFEPGAREPHLQSPQRYTQRGTATLAQVGIRARSESVEDRYQKYRLHDVDRKRHATARRQWTQHACDR